MIDDDVLLPPAAQRIGTIGTHLRPLNVTHAKTQVADDHVVRLHLHRPACQGDASTGGALPRDGHIAVAYGQLRFQEDGAAGIEDDDTLAALHQRMAQRAGNACIFR